ncbi:prephenate dehydratase [Mahella sp.]|uniref:prephenate dehydratase n=1 Tax=Mahella sp. TaxID=2798721 RepID=UPI0025BD720D|nr:prephenate dehydratase [Mahella sp.]MBZ4666681.1 prephenate dehydratase [Mahella sp.]
MKRLGFLGPDATFTQQAALEYCRYNPRQMVEYASIPDVIWAVASDKVDEGLVPIENSIEGAVNATMDMLAHEVDLFIVAELVLPVHQCLMARRGVDMGDITDIFSHPQALAQCQHFIHSNMPDVNVHNAYSTAAAAKLVAESDKPWAAIAMPSAAQRWGLDILVSDIQDMPGNATRFVVLSKQLAQPGLHNKTSIIFSVEDTPGSLYHTLKIFADKGINLTRIESRPAKKMLGQYLFFVDLIGHSRDDIVGECLEIISNNSSFYKYLGSYPVWEGTIA